MAITFPHEIKQGEAKTITVNVTRNNLALDVSAATFTFSLKETKDDAVLVTIADGSFNKTNAALGVVKFTLTETNTTTDIGLFSQETKKFIGELKIEITAGTDIDKSQDINFTFRRAVVP